MLLPQATTPCKTKYILSVWWSPHQLRAVKRKDAHSQILHINFGRKKKTFIWHVRGRKGHACMPSHFCCVWLFVTLPAITCRVPLSMVFFRQEYRSALPCPPPWNLPGAGIEPWSRRSPALTGGSFTTTATLGVKMPYFPLKKVVLVSGSKSPEVQGQRCSFSQWIGEADLQQLTNIMLRKATFHIWKFSIRHETLSL